MTRKNIGDDQINQVEIPSYEVPEPILRDEILQGSIIWYSISNVYFMKLCNLYGRT